MKFRAQHRFDMVQYNRDCVPKNQIDLDHIKNSTHIGIFQQ